ncbi:hypothetical protein QEK82_001555 [Stenotrophomonas maltophilia]|uniref:hypothetical protein n=1 Tax=Stenotrophomonas maltophilia group sp. Smal13 TaxID=3377166 RepID=UPI00131351AC|nr:hypothetical protein [Stenotrophomonas maltophilia]EKU9957635.1 hypothetical protein [Stenotrophomonas maltophilia]EKU9984757.1 hypothetical protein [Stenotrophomonas maltophilia]
MSIDSATERRKLQRLINLTTKGANAFYWANKALCEFCIEKYGCEPADVDCDQIIDSVQGGAGDSAGLTADEFDAAMREAMEMKGYG